MEGGEYFCPKIKKNLKVSEESYELCSDCRHSNSAKFIAIRTSENKAKTMGESLVCFYQGKSFEIPIAHQSLTEESLGGLARIIKEGREVPNLI